MTKRWTFQSRKKAIALVVGVGLSVTSYADDIGVARCSAGDYDSIVFEHVRVIARPGDEPLNNHTIVVEDDLIAAVGPADSIEKRGKACLIDGTGLTLMPGLADMHVHYYHEDEGALFIINGVTTVRDLWGQMPQIRLDIRAKTGDMVGPRVYMTGPLIDGPNPIWGDKAVVVDSPEAAIAAVDSQYSTGYEGIKLYEMLDEVSYRAAVGAAKARAMKVSSHTPRSMRVEQLLELKIDSIEHLDGYQDALSRKLFDEESFSSGNISIRRWIYADEKLFAPLARQTAEAMVWNVPTLTVYTQLRKYAAEPDKFFERSEIRYVPPSKIEYWRNALKKTNAEFEWSIAQKGNHNRAIFVKALYDAGAPLLIGTDTPNPFIVPGYSFHEELDNMSKIGIPNVALLRMATTDAARYLGVEGELGVVSVGSVADLILLNGDPLEDLSVLRAPVGAMVNGHWRTREELIALLESNASRYESAGKQRPE